MRTVASLMLLLFSSHAICADVKQFAQEYGFQPINPPQRVLNPESNLWKPGTVLWLDKVNRKLFPVPACENLFSSVPKLSQTQFATSGSSKSDLKTSFSLGLGLIGEVIKKIGIDAALGFDHEKHLEVKFTDLGSLLATSESIRAAVIQSSSKGKLSTECAATLRGPEFNRNSGAGPVRLRRPVFLVTETGIARGMQIAFTEAAKAQFTGKVTVPEVVELKPSWSSVRASDESVEIGAGDLPVVWGYRALPLSELVRTGAISAESGSEYSMKFGAPQDEGAQFDVRDLAEATFEAR